MCGLSATDPLPKSGPTAATFPSREVSLLLGRRLPRRRRECWRELQPSLSEGNRHMRRVLNQTANAAARTKGSIFEIVYRRSVPRWDTIKLSGPLPTDSVG
jgi:hypothetical protein